MILTNATYIHPDTLEFTQGDLRVTSGKPLSFVPSSQRPDGEERLDCTGMLVTKSFACGHHHAYSALSRGMGAPKKSPENFPEKLKYVWWALDKCLDTEMVRVSALVTAMACARNGVTFVIDHHASPFAVEGSLQAMAEAFEEVGVSHLLCYEISDRDGAEIADKGLAETADYLSKHQGLVGLHAGFTVGETTLQHAVALASHTHSGLHVHTAEDISDELYSIEHYGRRVVERFHEAGVLDFPATILAHGLHLDARERELVRNSPCWIVHNTESNQNNRVGVFSSAGLGNNIMLGTDGMHSDMLRAAKAAFYGAPAADNLDYAGLYQRFRNVHRYLAANQFRGDGDDNLVVLDYPSPTPLSRDNFFGHFLFGWDSSQVRHVISSGKLIVKDRRIVQLDEDEILLQARKLATKLWKRMQD